MADTEKITINMSVVDLGQVDLLVEEGFYSSRTDFIRTAIRNQLSTHADVVKQTVTRRTMVLGAVGYNRRDLEQVRQAGSMLDIRVVGLAGIAEDVTPELALATIQSIEVHGVLRASPAVREALGERIRK